MVRADNDQLARDLVEAIARCTTLIIPSDKIASVQKTLPPTLSYIVDFASGPVYLSEAADVLDAGADAIIVSGNDAANIFDGGDSPALPYERVIIQVDSNTAVSLPDLAASGLGGVLVQLPTDLPIQDAQAGDLISRFVEVTAAKKTGRPVYIRPGVQAISIEDAAYVHSLGGTLIVDISTIELVKEESQSASPDKLDFIGALLSPLKSDRADGLFPTTVVAASLSTSLGLVYSSRQSIRESILTGSAVYQSRIRGLWRKGESSGATQEVVHIRVDCDVDALEFSVRQRAGSEHAGFCHLTDRQGCFGKLSGLARLESTLRSRRKDAPSGSYTARIFSDAALLEAKIREEAAELVEAKDDDKQHVAFEMADLLYFALARCIRAGVSLEDIERSLDAKSKKITRRKGDAKPQFAQKAQPKVNGITSTEVDMKTPSTSDAIVMQAYQLQNVSEEQRKKLMQRPSIKTEQVMETCRPILRAVKERGDEAVLEYTSKFDQVTLDTPVILPPFTTDAIMAQIKPEVKTAIDQAYKNIYAFHKAQKKVGGNVKARESGTVGVDRSTGEEEDDAVLEVETMPGVVCRRFARPIENFGIYVPGGTAILPSTALMLGIPAQVAGCKTVVMATPPRPDGSITPEVLYVAEKVGATCILAAGGAQAVGAMAYGTQTCPKVHKIAGPGNQFVTAAKMLIQNDTETNCSIDGPAGPSEVLVIADTTSDPEFVASDLLSQAEHGPDSQVILVAIALSDEKLKAIEAALDRQAKALPRCEIVRKAIEKSLTIVVPTREEAIKWSNEYAPEHLIIQTEDAEDLAKGVINAGSVFIGQWSPESCGDYASGTNHTLVRVKRSLTIEQMY